MRQNWQMWSGVMQPDTIDFIVAEAEKVDSQAATTFNDQSEKNSFRSSEVSWLSGNNVIQDILWDFVSAANNNAFHVQVDNKCDMQFTEYHASKMGHYDWHHDVNWSEDNTTDRKLSVTVQLSDPLEYEGGVFEFSECPTPDDSSRKKGTVLVFPSYLKHRVLPVTKGTRRSLVAWFEGPRWQ